MIRVIKPGVLTTVQDLGRPGYQRFGVAVGGALDGFAARVVNLIVGNAPGAALLEIAQVGPELIFTEAAVVAWTGGDFDVRVDAEELPRDRAVRIAAGETVNFGVARRGMRAWLAIAGGIDAPVVMGSRATYRRAGLGGWHGRPLLAGDELKLLPPGDDNAAAARMLASRRCAAWSIRPETLGQQAAGNVVRAVPGPEWDWFGDEAHRQFFSVEWEATREADRMGVRLTGPTLMMLKPREMISAAVNTGVVQIPPSGQPIVLLPSRQSVGGYPRIAAVAGVDIGRFAQLRPGEKIRFEQITVQTAHALWLGREKDFNRARLGVQRAWT